MTTINSTAADLINAIEGIKGTMEHGVWRDENGKRLKDTVEWMAFYSSVRRSEPDTSGDAAEPEGYKHIIHASDGVTTIVVDDEPEHPFEPLEDGDQVETIPLFRMDGITTSTEPSVSLSTLKTILSQIRALKSHPIASEEAHGGYMDGRNDAALIIEEIIDYLSMADVEPLLTLKEKMDQAARCACHGSDDYCPCQNAPDSQTRRERAARKIAEILASVTS